MSHHPHTQPIWHSPVPMIGVPRIDLWLHVVHLAFRDAAGDTNCTEQEREEALCFLVTMIWGEDALAAPQGVA